MQTFFAILMIGFLWGTADLLRKVASGTTSNQLLATVFNFGTILAPLAFLLWIILKKQPLKYSLPHLGAALLGGLLAGIGGFLIFLLLSKGAQVSTTIPLIRILSIVLVATGGILLFSEPITTKVLIGLAFALIGIYLMLLG